MFWCADEDRTEWLFNTSAYKLTSKALKEHQQGSFLWHRWLFILLFWSLVLLFDQRAAVLAPGLSVLGVSKPIWAGLFYAWHNHKTEPIED